MSRKYKVSEGTIIGGMDPQPNYADQKKFMSTSAIVGGSFVEADTSADFAFKPAVDNSAKVLGFAFNDYATDSPVVVETEGFVKALATGSVTRGDVLGISASANVKTYVSGAKVGVAMNSAADGEEVYFKLNIVL